ncbi:MAG: hypothetical protein AAB444_02655 [Patescibacteria group bacterium]
MRGETTRGSDSREEEHHLTRAEILKHMLGLLGHREFSFSPQEKDQMAILAVSDKEKKVKIRANREKAVELIMDEVDILVKQGRISQDFFRGIAAQAEFAAEVIQIMATHPAEKLDHKNGDTFL